MDELVLGEPWLQEELRGEVGPKTRHGPAVSGAASTSVCALNPVVSNAVDAITPALPSKFASSRCGPRTLSPHTLILPRRHRYLYGSTTGILRGIFPLRSRPHRGSEVLRHLTLGLLLPVRFQYRVVLTRPWPMTEQKRGRRGTSELCFKVLK